MAALGSPVVGDTRYDVVPGLFEDDLPAETKVELGPDPSAIALRASRLEFTWKGAPVKISAAAEDWHKELRAAFQFG